MPNTAAHQGETPKLKKKWLRLLFLALACGIVIIALSALPGVLERYLISSLRTMGFTEPRLRIRALSLTNLDIVDFSVGGTGTSGLQIPHLALDFSVPSIFGGHIRSLTVTGMKTRLEFGPETIRWQGLENLFREGGKSASQLPKIDRILFRSCQLMARWQGKNFWLPFDLELRKRGEEEVYLLSGQILAAGEVLKLQGDIRFDSGDGAFMLEAVDADLAGILAEWLPPEVRIQRSRVNLRARLEMKSWNVRKAEASVNAPMFAADLGNGNSIRSDIHLAFGLDANLKPKDLQLKLRLRNLSTRPLAVSRPCDIRLSGANLENLKFTSQEIVPASWPGVVIRSLSGSVSLKPDLWRLDGSIRCEARSPLFQKTLPDSGATGTLNAEARFFLEKRGEKIIWDVRGSGGGRMGFSLPERQLDMKRMTVEFHAANVNDKTRLDFNALVFRPRLRLDSLTYSAEQLRIPGWLVLHADGAVESAGNVFMTAADLAAASTLSASGINGVLPWTVREPERKTVRPVSPSEPQSRLRVKSLSLAGLNLGEADLSLSSLVRGIKFQGAISLPLSGSPQAQADGHCCWRGRDMDLALQVRIPEKDFAQAIDLEPLHPSLKGNRFSGRFSLAADISYANGAWKSQGGLKIGEGVWLGAGDSFLVQGIELNMKMDDLFAMKSAVSQTLNFAVLQTGAASLTVGNIVFTLESPDAIFVEGGQFDFMGGKITVRPFRYSPDEGEATAALVCERVNFGRLLNLLLGKTIASGEAELNGTLTLIIRDGQPMVQGGDLYSTPGVSGNLKFQESQAIAGGVLIVEEALKDFNYQWIKVTMRTLNRKLDIVAQIQGAPAQKLPLTYDSKLGDIVREKKGKRKIELKGLTLDVHFKDIDLEKLLREGKRLDIQFK